MSAGEGVTVTTWTQSGGSNTLQAAATVTTVTCDGGELVTDGGFLITTLNVNGGEVTCLNAPAAGNAITTLNATGGTTDGGNSSIPRTWATVNMGTDNATLTANASNVTITTLNEPSGQYTLVTNR